MEDRDYKSDYEEVAQRYNSMCEAANILQAEKLELSKDMLLLQQKLRGAQNALDLNKEIMQNALTRQNEITVEYTREIQELKGKLASHGDIS